MNFRFDIDKAIAATAYLIQKAGGKYNILFLVKALYHANRSSLVQYARSITGDSLSSMEKGPVVSESYDLMKGSKEADPEHLKKWRQFISERNVNTLTIVNPPDYGYLSGRETELLDSAYAAVSSVRGTLKDWSHKVFPEWEDPGNIVRSRPIDPTQILKLEHKSDEEIADIEEEIAEVNWLRSIAK